MTAQDQTRRETLMALAERCERESATWELERKIAEAVNWYRPHPDHTRSITETPRFCTSLDAAVTLEVAGFLVTVVAGKGQPCAVGFLDVESGVQINAEASTEPMARCAAALRAIAQEVGDG